MQTKRTEKIVVLLDNLKHYNTNAIAVLCAASLTLKYFLLKTQSQTLDSAANSVSFSNLQYMSLKMMQ